MRSPRRRFAVPFVITVVGAAGSIGATSCNPTRVVRPPDNDGTGTGPVAQGEERWTVFKRGDACEATQAANCPPNATCNPPPPVAYPCPEGMTMDRPLEIVMYAGTTTCQTVPPPIDCPPNVMCNPPPPRQVPCPTR